MEATPSMNRFHLVRNHDKEKKKKQHAELFLLFSFPAYT